MRPNNDQKTVTRVISQIMQKINDLDLKDPEIYQYIDEEINTLIEIVPFTELNQLRNDIYDMYIIIKELK